MGFQHHMLNVVSMVSRTKYWATFHSPRLALGAYLLHLGHDIKKEDIDLTALLGCILRSIRTAASR